MNTPYVQSDAAYNSAVSWSAILGGAFAAAAASLSLAVLGSGLGLAVISPFSGDDFSIAAFTTTAAIWMIIMQWGSSALGGYMAGRLRTRWSGQRTNDEVMFRDTSHGFLAWAVASLMTAAFLTSSVSMLTKHATDAASVVASSEAETNIADPVAYYVDGLYRSTRTSDGVSEARRDETTRILLRGISEGSFSDADRDYMTALVTARTGLTEVEANERIDAVMTDIAAAKEKADEARKAAATFSIVTFLSFLIGAFIASVSAVIGGRHRDEF